MDRPKMFDIYRAAPDIHVIPSYFPIPGMGIIPINAFVLKAREPVLVDTGQAFVSDQFIETLSSAMDPRDLRWLFLTHVDPDHIGGLFRVLNIAPSLRVITTYLALGKMSLFNPLPRERVFLLNPGQGINVGDRTLVAVKPPAYDAPETTGFYDHESGAFFCADCFGALMTEPADNAAAIPSERLREGLITWATVDSPWLHSVDRDRFARELQGVRKSSPKIVLSSHLPAARDMTEELLQLLSKAPAEKPFVGPDQLTLEAMLKQPRAA